MLSSKTWSPETPFELQRRDGESMWTVVGYYAATPPEASARGYRAIKRDAPTKARREE